MRIRCQFCGKSTTTEVPDSTIVRAIVICPECFERADRNQLEVLKQMKLSVEQR